MVNAEVVERQVLELLRWFDIPQHAQEDVAKAVITLCRETGGDDDYIRAEAARRELTLRRERVLEMYRDGLCERKFRDCKYWNSQIYTLGSPGRVRKTPLERRERQYRQQGTNLQGVDGGS